jgi:hypothetical protein
LSLTSRGYPGISTSAARFENGTTISLAKIPGTADYVALMETLVGRTTTPYWLSYIVMARDLRRTLGLPRTKESGVLAEMISALKTASETALQTEVKAVAVTAPWMAAWKDEIPHNSIINDALLLAGIDPWHYSWADEAIYLSEINTALASEERWLCPKHSCAGHWMEPEGEITEGGAIFVIRLVILFDIRCFWVTGN